MHESAYLSRPRAHESEANQHHDQGPELPAIDTPAVLLENEAARRVRRNWLGNISRLSRLGQVMLLITTLLTIGQLIASCVVLAISTRDACDQPLRLFIVIYMLRVILVYPLSIYQHMNPIHRRHTDPERSQRQTCAIQAVDRVKSTMDLFGMLWFVIGNWWLFTSSTCYKTSPSQFYLSLAFIILAYFIITLPLFLCGAVIFCLPCVIVVMRVLRITDSVADGHHAGASEEVIQKIPIVRFKAMESIANDGNTDGNAPFVSINNNINRSATIANTSPARPSRRIRWANPSKWLKKKRGKRGNRPTTDCNTVINMSALHEPELVLAQVDALCVICLNEYEDEDRLRQLPCNHHFHMNCVDEWLRLNSTCPLCVQNVHKDNEATAHTNSSSSTIHHTRIILGSEQNSEQIDIGSLFQQSSQASRAPTRGNTESNLL
ncbi:hypothetical protein SeMB42_g03879 [Synchytrium endobioticum]|nr:hypothetical protein SeMB42_g03879 [Synchytrium endobioticum]